MERRYFVSLLAVFVAILTTALFSVDCRGQEPIEQHWELEFPVMDADLSPDDRLVAVTRELPQKPKRGENVEEWVEVWDFREQRQVAKLHIATYMADWMARTRPVRFTSDGKFVVAACVTVIGVFDAGTLKVVRTIDLASYGVVSIRRMEISPASHTAVVAVEGGELFVIDLDSGRILLRQSAAFGSSFFSSVASIAWKPDGSQFAVAVGAPCSDMGVVQIFGVNPVARLEVLSSKNVAAVAFSADRLYAVQVSVCKGTVFNRHLGMQVFDTRTWMSKRTIHLPGKDLHDSVSYAEGRLLADSGVIESRFDAGDLVTNSFAGNLQLTLWSGDAKSILYRSSAVNIRGGRGLRLSRTGRMAMIVDGRVWLIPLP